VPDNLVQVRRYVLLVQPIRREEPLEHAVERNIVISGNVDSRQFGQPLKERTGLFELLPLCPLGIVTAVDQDIGFEPKDLLTVRLRLPNTDAQRQSVSERMREMRRLLLGGTVVLGAVAVVLIARLAPAPLGSSGVATLCGLAAILGHMFPFYLGFRGGKGIATSAGVFAALEPTAFWVCLGVFAITFLASGGIVSLGSLLGSLALPIAIGIAAAARGSVDWTRLLLVCALVVVVWVRHAANIRRLLHGDEKGLLRQRRNQAAALTGAREEIR